MAVVKLSGRAVRLARHARQLPVVGWREWIALPTLDIGRIKAKIDTGARTSSLHAFDISEFTKRGVPHVAFVVHTQQRRRTPAVECQAPVHDQRLVTSSTGHRQRRYVIKVEIAAGGLTWPIELTLADRDAMGFRMLLGRQALRRRFLIDPSRSYLAGEPGAKT
ncbi:MAG: ATP-dependent zinc protease [Alphaproteobacteria bacterium]